MKPKFRSNFQLKKLYSTVKNVEIVNLTGEALGYSNYSYDTKGATIDNVVYPSIDPMIFEVRYPDSDIYGRIVTY